MVILIALASNAQRLNGGRTTAFMPPYGAGGIARHFSAILRRDPVSTTMIPVYRLMKIFQ
jgi:hypothetical protein